MAGNYKVLLVTSGLGSRLGEITKFTNKSLIKLGHRAAICEIIDRYPADIEIVITLGHHGNLVKDFLEMFYPERKFAFAWVDNYDGPGSSLVYSILQSEQFIDRPFVFHTCDTIVGEAIPEPIVNWLGCFHYRNSNDYRSVEIEGERVIRFHEKGSTDFDAVYIGVAGIHDYQQFFSEASQIYNNNTQAMQLSDVHVSQSLINKGHLFQACIFNTWFDIGNIDRYREAQQHYSDQANVLEKNDESIFLCGDKVVKFFSDAEIVRRRVARAESLYPLVPKVLDSRDNFYMYEFAPGNILSEVINDDLIDSLLVWAENNLWVQKLYTPEFQQQCESFYFDKTKARVHKFLDKHQITDQRETINGTLVPPINELLQQIDIDWLCSGQPSGFHGDFILDNILVDGGKFTLLDWRQDFAGSLNSGDMYYDLAKLNHSLILNHKILNKNGYTVTRGKQINVELMSSYNLICCREKLFKFIRLRKLDEEKVHILSALIWLNMSPLHRYPLSIFLFYFGKLNLHRRLHENDH